MSKTVADIAGLITVYYPRLRKVFRNIVAIKDVPISMTQLTGLSIIGKHGKLTMTDLANELCMSNQQLTKVVDALCGFGMAERVTDDANRRKIYAQITDKGAQTLADFRNEVNAGLSKIVQTSNEDELDKLYYCIAHIASYLGYKE